VRVGLGDRVVLVVVRRSVVSSRSSSEAWSVSVLAYETAELTLVSVDVDWSALTSMPAWTGPKPPETLTPSDVEFCCDEAVCSARSRLFCSVDSRSCVDSAIVLFTVVTVSLVLASTTCVRPRTSLARTFSMREMSASWYRRCTVRTIMRSPRPAMRADASSTGSSGAVG
jgi:hypothetical protein